MERVLRLRPGDEVEVADGDGRIWRRGWSAAARSSCWRRGPSRVPRRRWSVRLALTGPRSDTAIEKLVELGVEDISPLETAAVKRRAAHRPLAADRRGRRGQAKRPRIPASAPAVTLADALQPGAILLSHEEPDGSLDDAIARTPHGRSRC